MTASKVCVNRGCTRPVKKGSRFCGGLGANGAICLTPKAFRYEDAPLTGDEMKKVEALKTKSE